MMSEDAKAILLLCGQLGGASDAAPLDQFEYTIIARWLRDRNLRPSDLLTGDSTEALAQDSRISVQRLGSLLQRGAKLAFAIEAWNQSGIWVVCRSDQDYPARYKDHLRDKAPPILFCTGNRSLLCGGGLAIVGSRNVDADGAEYARDVASWCARSGMMVVSGGARGVDQVAMASAAEAGGSVVGILADSLLRRSVARDTRDALADGRILLVSPYHPDAGFTAANAMARNRLIYALADYALVVSAEHGRGGTWGGATEELKRIPARPVFVRIGPGVPKGNDGLLKNGGIAFPTDAMSREPAIVFDEALRVSREADETANDMEPELLPLAEEPDESHTKAKPVKHVRHNPDSGPELFSC